MEKELWSKVKCIMKMQFNTYMYIVKKDFVAEERVYTRSILPVDYVGEKLVGIMFFMIF